MTALAEETDNTTETRLLAGGLRVPTIGLIALVTLLAFDEMAVGTVMPVTVRDLGGFSLYAWGFSATLIASLFANVVAGGWADKAGPARPMLFGLGGFLTGLLIAGIAPSMGWFVVGRGIQGLGAGGALTSTYVLIARVYPESLRPRVFSAMAAAWVVPSLVGPALAGFVAEHLQWRVVFLGLIALVVPAALMLARVLRDSGGGSGGTLERSRPLAALAVAGGAALLLYGVDHRSWILSPIGLAGLVAGLPRLLPAGSFRLRRGVPTAVVVRILFSAAFFGTEAFIPLGLTRLHGFTPTEAGIVLTVGALGWSGASWIQGRSSRPRAFFVVVGIALVAVGTAVIALTLSAPGSLATWISGPAWVTAGAGMGLGLASISVLVMNQSDAEHQGANSSALQISDTLGSSLAVGLAGAVVTGFPHLSTGLRVAGAATALLAVIGFAAAFRVVAFRVEHSYD